MGDVSYSYSPDIKEREISDGGFSKGWGMHFPACEKGWIDLHAHLECCPAKVNLMTKDYIRLAKDLNITKTVLILPMLAKQTDETGQLSMQDYFPDSESVKQYISMIEDQPRFRFFIYLDHRKPDAALIKEAAEMGVCGVKLHNAPLITNGDDHEIWLSDGWSKVFKEIQDAGLPVLWHVTQRLSDSPYTGGGRNTYWKDGWVKGVKYTNEDLLQVFLKIVEAFPGINFIAAHQLHLGWERLTGLFDRFGNLFSDTSIGCILKKYDELYDHDRDYLRDIFIRYSKRMLLGADVIIDDNFSAKKCSDIYEEHIRFIKRLSLPYEALQDVSNLNAERLLKLR